MAHYQMGILLNNAATVELSALRKECMIVAVIKHTPSGVTVCYSRCDVQTSPCASVCVLFLSMNSDVNASLHCRKTGGLKAEP